MCLVITVCQAQPTCSSGRGQCRSLCNVWEKEDKHSNCGAGCKCCVVPTDGKTKVLPLSETLPLYGWCVGVVVTGRYLMFSNYLSVWN